MKSRTMILALLALSTTAGCDEIVEGSSTSGSATTGGHGPGTAADDPGGGVTTTTGSHTTSITGTGSTVTGEPTLPESTSSGSDTGSHGSSTGAEIDPFVMSVDDCVTSDERCTCTPLQEENTCVHSNGGEYPNLGCSAGYQCCNGEWFIGRDSCGSCLCTDPSGALGCEPAGNVRQICHPKFQGTIEEIPADIQTEMTGNSWNEGASCPPFSELRLLRLSHWNFEGGISQGELVVHADVSVALLGVFEALYEARFPIERMVRIDAYGGSISLALADNNSFAFNCPPPNGGFVLAEHRAGRAIDLNPVQNPTVNAMGGLIQPDAGAAYIDRTNVRPGMIVDDGATAHGPVVRAFGAIGWTWHGGSAGWRNYQHFALE